MELHGVALADRSHAHVPARGGVVLIVVDRVLNGVVEPLRARGIVGPTLGKAADLDRATASAEAYAGAVGDELALTERRGRLRDVSATSRRPTPL